MVPLGEVAKPAGSRAGSDTDLPVYSVTKHAGFVPSLEYFKKQVFSRDVGGYKLVQPGHFAYATIHLDEGSIGIAPERALISPMYTVFGVDEVGVEPSYLIRYLKSPRAMAHYQVLGKGAIHRRKAISFQALSSLPVPLPPLDEQRRIAAILDQADAVRAKRREVLTHLDTLTQSIFHTMFGREADLPRVPLGSVVGDLQGGKSVVADDSASHSPYRVLKISAVTSGRFRPEESKPLPPDYLPPANHLVSRDDLLISRANTAELVGAVAIVDVDCENLALPDKLWRVVWRESDSVESTFACSAFQTREIRRELMTRSSGTGGSMKNISKAKLLAMPFPVPPLQRQHEFALRVETVNAQRARVLAAQQADDELFASLQSRAFRGEL